MLIFHFQKVWIFHYYVYLMHFLQQMQHLNCGLEHIGISNPFVLYFYKDIYLPKSTESKSELDEIMLQKPNLFWIKTISDFIEEQLLQLPLLSSKKMIYLQTMLNQAQSDRQQLCFWLLTFWLSWKLLVNDYFCRSSL